MKVIIACEESQAVCTEFRKRGHEAYSCDIQECTGGHPEWHIKGDCLEVIYGEYWDLMIGHPPCTYLSSAGLHWCNVQKHGDKAIERIKKRDAAKEFFLKMWNAPIGKICLENPCGHMSKFLPHTQIIEPYYFGDCDRKRTALWLKNLPPLFHSAIDDLFTTHTHTHTPQPLSIDSTGKKRYFTDAKNRSSISRSKTFPGIAKAMADQWGENNEINVLQKHKTQQYEQSYINEGNIKRAT